jgi:Spy/CpxP family protein refolding chaperone
MKSLARLLLVAALSGAFLTTSAQEQRKGRGGMMDPEQRIERLEQALGALSAEQKAKIKAVYAQSAEKMRTLPEDERREKMMEMMQEAGRQVRAVLTADQQKKYDEMMAQMRQGGGERRKQN